MISGDVKDFMATFGDAISTVASAVLGAIIGFAVARPKQNAEIRKLEQEAEAVQDSSDTSRIAAMMDGYEKRIQILIDGYEARVADLTREVESLRSEVKMLRQVLDPRSPAHFPQQGQKEV